MFRCQALPLPDYQVSFQIDGQERLRWHYGTHYPRPFFYPLPGPSGQSLTRMGHPGDFSHEHHRSIWFAHHDVLGNDFWSDRTTARVRQESWLVYHDGPDEAAMAVNLGWFDGHDAKLLEQELIVGVREAELPEQLSRGETLIELQATFRPTGQTLTLGKTNFGMLAVRVAKHISEFFGGGKLTDSEGRQTEAEIFGKRATWMDYSGPVTEDQTEGVTYFDHPANPGHPAHWHVREDGWMGASLCFAGPIDLKRDEPLTLRYLLHAHSGPIDAGFANRQFERFAASPRYELQPSGTKHGKRKLGRAAG